MRPQRAVATEASPSTRGKEAGEEDLVQPKGSAWPLTTAVMVGEMLGKLSLPALWLKLLPVGARKAASELECPSAP